MDQEASFGTWLRQRYRELDLTKAGLAECVGCSVAMIKKMEAGARRPSRQVAERLATCLGIPTEEHAAFLRFARSNMQAPSPAAPQASSATPWRSSTVRSTTRPGNLPAALNSLIGREKQREIACDMLRRPGVRLMTIAGPPGIGKTRLALQVARELIDGFEAGAFFVQLAPITEPDLVTSTVARVLGVTETSNRPLLESLMSYLRGLEMLLVLDNFEQVIAAAPLLADLLESAPGLKILVTSRSVLRLYGEHELRLPPLLVPARNSTLPVDRLLGFEGVALFIERAQAVRPGFAPTGPSVEAIAEIARHLDGLPLAIELAAARARSMSPQAILERLKQEEGRLRLLTGGAGNLAPRQQTLGNAITWSYGLLDAEEQAVFRRVSLFAGGFTLDAAEALWDSQPVTLASASAAKSEKTAEIRVPVSSIQDHLGSLVDKSLLKNQGSRPEEQGDGAERFTMLETIREYGYKALSEAGEAEPAHRAHALYYTSLSEQAESELRGPDQAEWLERLEYEQDNLRVALRWAHERREAEIGLRMVAALYRFWERRGHWTEGRKWFAAMLLIAEDHAFPALRAKALYEAGWLAWRQDDYVQARRLFEDSLSLARRAGDRRAIIPSLMGLGNIAIDGGEYAGARRFQEEVLAISRELGDKSLMSSALASLGQVARFEGSYAEARSQHEESLRIREELGDSRSIAISLNNLGEVARCQGHYDHARALHEQGQAIAQQMGDKLGLAFSFRALGDVYLAEGRLDEAQSHYRNGLSIQRELGNKSGIVGCLDGLARVWLARMAGGHVPAPDAARTASTLFAAAQALRDASGAHLPPAEIELHERDISQARAQLDERAWQASWDFGRAIPLDQVTELALQQG